jgi:peptide/nickel transport system permease protein
VGITSGYLGGKADLWIQRVVELMLAFPELPLYLSVIAILPKTVSPQTTFVLFVLLLGCLKWAQLAREVRGKALVLREMDYVKSAIAAGASDGRIVVHHILPNVLPRTSRANCAHFRQPSSSTNNTKVVCGDTVFGRIAITDK